MASEVRGRVGPSHAYACMECDARVTMFSGAQKKQYVFGFGLVDPTVDPTVDPIFGSATDEDKALLGGKVRPRTTRRPPHMHGLMHAKTLNALHGTPLSAGRDACHARVYGLCCVAQGAYLRDMASLGMRVPPGFTISTAACAAFTDSEGDGLTPSLI